MCSPSLISSINTGHAVPVALAAGNPGIVTVEDGGGSDPITITPGGDNDALISVSSTETFAITHANKATVFDAINRALAYKAT